MKDVIRGTHAYCSHRRDDKCLISFQSKTLKGKADSEDLDIDGVILMYLL
jgi:hypothetical protein